VTGALKALTGRCRPRAHDGRTCVGGEYDAFPSGHTSTIASIAGVRLVHALRSGPGSEARFVSLALAEAATVATGALRIASGAHSWDDVLGGFALGHGIGALVALAHPWSATERPPAPPIALREVPGAAGPTELPLATPSGPTLGGTFTTNF
jgi:membrane-associated phospholipid phosphatase